MVTEKTFDRVLSDFRSECKVPGKLFAAFKMDDITDKWSVLVATEQVTEEVKREIFFKLVDLFVRHLDDDERNSIARIGMYSVQDHLVQLILNAYKTGDEITSDQKINGNVIHEGYIALAVKERNAQVHHQA
jgi:hypothetical protein